MGDGSSQKISSEFLLQNLDYFVKNLSLIANISQDESLKILRLLWPIYIPKKGYFPNYCNFMFYGELEDFLLKKQRKEIIKYGFNQNPSVKDAIEALGIPHTEVGTIFINKKAVDFSYNLQNQDKIDIYPMIYKGIKREFSFIPKYLSEILFVVDVHLGSLAKFLRMAGFNTKYNSSDIGDLELSKISENENRIILTRDIGLLKRANVNYGYWVRNTDPKKQFQEIVERYNISKDFKAFSRCTECNGINIPISIEDVKKRTELPVRITIEYDSFKTCKNCHKVYWEGSHHKKMKIFLKQFTL